MNENYSLEKMLSVHSGMEGWCTPEKATRLYNLVLESDAQLICELGVFYGKSLMPMGFACAAKGSGQVIGVDAWDNYAALEGNNDERNNEWWLNINMDTAFQSTLNTISDNDLNFHTQIAKAKSVDAVGLFPDYSLGILHIDSVHNEVVITRELELYTPKIKPHGFLIADDTSWFEAKAGYAKLPEFGLKLIEDHTDWQIWQKSK